MTAPTPYRPPQLTNWEQYGLADIWDMVKHEDGELSWRQVKAWWIMRELCDHHAKRLRVAAEDLAKRWPPERSPAASVFIQKLQSMAAVFTRAAEAATQNSMALRILTTSLWDTRSRVKALRETWRHYEHLEAERATVARRYSPVPLPWMKDRDIIVMTQMDPLRTMVNLAGAPQFPFDWRQQLDKQARQLMTDSDRTATDSRTTMRQPPVMEPRVDMAGTWPPIRPGPPTRGSSPHISIPTYSPPPPRPGRSPWEDGVLDGAGPSLGGGSQPTMSGGSHVPGLPPDVSGSQAPASGGVMALPPGGVIGQRTSPTPGVLEPRPTGMRNPAPTGFAPVASPIAGGRAASGRSNGFIAPPGGVIAGRPNGAATQPPVAAGLGVRRRRQQDLDEPWTVHEGVAPVIEPKPEPTGHDPGPGVIGIDR